MSASAVLVNPARVGNVLSLRRSIQKGLSEAGWPEPTWLQTTPTESGEELTRQAVRSGAKVVFVCGGDGTVMAAAAAVAGTDAALAVIPFGTGNVLALNLGLPTDVAGGVRAATRGGRRTIDLGEVEGRIFVVATGMGLDAQMLADTSHRGKHRFGWVAYAAAALRHLADPTFSAEVSLDGGPSIRRDVRSVLVANVGRLPGGINLLPLASADDGLLHVALIAPRRLRDWAMLLASLVGRQPRGGRLETYPVRRVEVTASHPQPREIDGDPFRPGVKLVVRVRPSALLVCVPLALATPPRPR